MLKLRAMLRVNPTCKRKGKRLGSKRTIKLKHFGNRSMHIENYNTKCFIEITRLELKRFECKFRLIDRNVNKSC
jgi:hypothetical protein